MARGGEAAWGAWRLVSLEYFDNKNDDCSRHNSAARPMNRLFKMPPQVVRIVLLAVGIVVVYSVARYVLTPPSFRQYGWYRGVALMEIATRDQVYAGKKACEECHSDEYQKLLKHEHKGLACESCHGPGEAHAQDPRKENID